MRYGAPREVQHDGEGTGVWRFAEAHGSDGRRGIWAVGACADCDGHATPDEAREHMAQYVRSRDSVALRAPEHPRDQQWCKVGECREKATAGLRDAANALKLVCSTHDSDRSWLGPVGDYASSM